MRTNRDSYDRYRHLKKREGERVEVLVSSPKKMAESSDSTWKNTWRKKKTKQRELTTQKHLILDRINQNMISFCMLKTQFLRVSLSMSSPSFQP